MTTASPLKIFSSSTEISIALSPESDSVEVDLIQSIPVHEKLEFTKIVYASRIERKFAEQQQFANQQPFVAEHR